MSKPSTKTIQEWWQDMSLEQQFYLTIEYNWLIEGDRTRHPSTLTEAEIRAIYSVSTRIYNLKDNLQKEGVLMVRDFGQSNNPKPINLILKEVFNKP